MKIIYFLTWAIFTNQLFAFNKPTTKHHACNPSENIQYQFKDRITLSLTEIKEKRDAYFSDKIKKLNPIEKINFFLKEGNIYIREKRNKYTILEKITLNNNAKCAYLRAAVEANMEKNYILEANIYLIVEKIEMCAENKRILSGSAKHALYEFGTNSNFHLFHILKEEYVELIINATRDEQKKFLENCAEIAPSIVNITPFNVNIAPSDVNIAPFNANITPSDANIAPFNANITPSFYVNIAPSNANIAPFNANITPFNTNIAPSNINIAPFNANITPFNVGLAPFNANITPFNANIAPPYNVNLAKNENEMERDVYLKVACFMLRNINLINLNYTEMYQPELYYPEMPMEFLFNLAHTANKKEKYTNNNFGNYLTPKVNSVRRIGTINGAYDIYKHNNSEQNNNNNNNNNEQNNEQNNDNDNEQNNNDYLFDNLKDLFSE